MTGRCGLLLLTGGEGRRLGGTKHDRPHPSGDSWGGHLVRVFQELCGEDPVRLLGASLPDLPGLEAFDDPREGPAVALCRWAALSHPPVRRWWILPCDQVEWGVASFSAWLLEAEEADPEGMAWVMTEREDHAQPLGGFLGQALLPRLAKGRAVSVRALAESLPCRYVPGHAFRGRDLDTPQELAAWRSALGEGWKPR